MEGRQGRGSPRFGWLDGGEKDFSCQKNRLAEGNATRERKECAERTFEGMIVLMQFKEGGQFLT